MHRKIYCRNFIFKKKDNILVSYKEKKIKPKRVKKNLQNEFFHLLP